jgi:hypothetical protein
MKKILFLILSINLSSCAMLEAMNKKPLNELDSLSNANKMNIKTFFDGDMNAVGIRQDKNDKIIGTYLAKINAKWDENKGVIKYNFTLTEGKKDSRTWLLTLSDDNSFEGVGHDVSGSAQGTQVGNAMRMIYTLSFKKDGKKEEVKYEDRVYLVDEKSAIMISKSSKTSGERETTIISLTK